ncbi:peptide/nickel transport system substrate-binding protein [Loktanella fryxellensis]|uniref:Peptide/nickel transport system substrate-binding protein n=1 Tax=Loktanella fryxellensis TaxID=245187 RepID=A0A1H8IIC0_9RHOB|nr:ABC transporter substrate-binding protein [Loktanella fryxellensis]SEN68121.1 peptide/nickel transport system substrate-binding protein [Loktanella fryxellensis]
MTRMPDPIHPAARRYADEVARGTLSRREFLTRATALGVAAPAAYGLLGLTQPVQAQAAMQQGGTLRIQMEVRALKDPRSYDWPQMANYTRGWLEYLTEYQIDGTITPMLLDRWEVNGDATEYVLHVRPGVTWNDGSPFTAADVAFNLTRWCDAAFEGNSMASRVGALMQDGVVREGAITMPDDMTVVLALSAPDISFPATFADFPAAIVPQDFTGDPLATAKGTGPYLPDGYEVGIRAALVKNADHAWWGTGAALDRIEFVDMGQDQAAVVSGTLADEFDMTYETIGEFKEIMEGTGWTLSTAQTAATMVIRANQLAEVDGQRPYADVRVRRALAMALDNAVLLELGMSGDGEVAANHHVAPIHPEYADIGPAEVDPAAALALLEEAGMADFAHDLISIDDTWRKATCDAAAAQWRDAGINVTRTVIPGATFYNDWTTYPLSATDWGHRPLGVQTLAVAYRTGEPWNEAGYSNPDFDALLAQALSLADADARRAVMADIEQLLRDDGVIIQPYWRSVYRHAKPNVVGVEQHPTFEMHLYKFGLSA